MKESNYNFYINDHEANIYLIYNALKNTLIRDNEGKVQKFVKQFKDNIHYSPKYLTKEEYNDLVSSGIIVSNDTKEKQVAIDRNKKRFEILHQKKESLSLVITPTLCCNFKCYYCFESLNTRKNEEFINIEVQNDIINFIKKSIEENHVQKIYITWYGGEPLIQRDIIFSMQEKINELCKINDVKLMSTMVSNGFLLSPEVCGKLYELGIKQIQITIDGPEQIHNKRRYYPVNPSNNYNQIVENILQANDKIMFNFRVNIDKTNKDYIFELIDDLIKRKVWPYKRNVHIYTAQVRANNNADFVLSTKEYAIIEENIRCYLIDKYNEIMQTNKAKRNFLYPKFGGNVECGYGVFPNSWVISYNGDVFRCWESVGQAELKVGTMKDLLEDFGQSIFNKVKLDTQTFERWGCFDCKFFPICGSKCPWDFVKHKRCIEWKEVIEYRLLSQYKLFLKEPAVYLNTPFNVEINDYNQTNKQ